MKSYYYSEIFDRMISCDALGAVYPCIGVKDAAGKDIMLGHRIEYTDPMPELRTMYYEKHPAAVIGEVKYDLCRFVLKFKDGSTIDPAAKPASSMKIIGHITDTI